MTTRAALRRVAQRVVRGAVRGVVVGAAVVVGVTALATVAGGAFVAWPLDDALLRGGSSVQVLARDGTVLATGLDDAGGRSLPLDDVPILVAAAFVAVEDRRFFQHHGVDPQAVARALKDSVAAGRVVSGASTITQQLARLLGKRSGDGLVGKLQEALWALRLDAQLEKVDILRAYLDRVPLGRNAHGVGAASRMWFDARPELLSPSQAALLAGLAHAPELEDPIKFPERARARRDLVLRRMRDSHVFGGARNTSDDDDAYARAVADAVDVRLPGGADFIAPHLAARLREHPPAGAVVVQTTIDPALQREVEAILKDEVVFGPHRKDGLRHAAVVVVDNATSEILAWAGSADFFDDEGLGKNDGVLMKRQPGSALKPFVYGRALETRQMTAATILEDVDTDLALSGSGGADGAVYRPQNYDRRMHGPVTLRAALQNSYNVPAIQVARRLGPDAVLDVLQGAGFRSLDKPARHYGVGLVLGNGEVTLHDMATAWSGLARGGRSRPLVVVAGASDEKRNSVPLASDVLASEGRREQRFLAADTVALLTHILQDDAARAPAFGLDNALDLEFPVAAKTGTSRSYVDNWTAGFTAERTVAVWAGSFDGAAMRGVSGITGAGVIFRRIMEAAMRGLEPAPLVDDRRFARARTCPLSGQLATSSCPGVDEVFLPGTAPTTTCTVHGHGNRHGNGASVDASAVGCAPGERPLALSGPLGAWASREGRCQTAPDATSTTTTTTTNTTAIRQGPRILSPRDGDVFAIEPGLPQHGSGQEVPLQSSAGVVRVVVDGVAREPQGWLALAAGPHTLQAIDDAGAVVDVVTVTVH